MKLKRRTVAYIVLGAGACLLAGPFVGRLFAGQEQAPNRRDVTITGRNYQFSPGRVVVLQDDLVKVTLRSEDHAHSFAIDEYRIVKRVPAGGSTTFEFRADKPGTFTFYCNLTNDAGCRQMRGELVVNAR